MKRSLWIFALMLLVACGNSNNGEPNLDGSVELDASMDASDAEGTPDAGTAAFDEYTRELASAVCERLECFGTSGLARANALAQTGGTTGEECVDVLATRYAHTYDSVRARVEAGVLAYDADAVDECFDDPTCSDLVGNSVGPCLDDAVTGLVDVGGVCDSEYECSAGTTCVGREGPCPGTCMASVSIGEICDPLVDHCDPGALFRAECESVSESESRCFGYRSDGTGQVGDVCPSTVDDGYVHVTVYCNAELVCDTSGDPDVCAARTAPTKVLGEACEIGECVGDLICVGTCEEATLVSTVGERCGADSEVGLAMCDTAHGVTCVLPEGAEDTVCQPIGDGELGDVCAPFDPQNACDDGMYCSVTTLVMYNVSGVCAPKLATGEGCNGDEACVSGLCLFDNATFSSRCVDPVAYCE